MKKFLLSLILMLAFLVSSTAQFVYNKDGEIVPFSLSKKYRDIIDTSKINTCILPSYNNDSLFWEANFEYRYVKSGHKSRTAVAFPIDTLIDFKKVASKFKLDNGTLWIYCLYSDSAERLGVRCEYFTIPEGGLWATYSSKSFRKRAYALSKIDFDRFNKKGQNINTLNTGNKVYVEYFEPKGAEFSPNIIIKELAYGYQGLKKKGLKTLPSRLKKNIQVLTLKGAAGSGDDCQYDLVCSSVPDYREESKSVCYFEYSYTDENGIDQVNSGTGFFINKGGDYSSADKPFFITAGHCFDAKDENGQQIDFSDDIPYFEVEVNLLNEKCNDPAEYTYGTSLPNAPKFKVVELGTSYNKDVNSPDYVESEDYAIVQAAGTVNDYANYEILYNGWISQLYNTTDWVAIGHVDRTQKIFVDNDQPGELPNGADGFTLNFEKGLVVPGVSGAPVYNYKRQVVGWICGMNANGSCDGVGTNEPGNKTYCGGIPSAYSNIEKFIDPLKKYTASAYTAPIPGVPSHCKNCVQDTDKGETDMDCGGPCLPCGITEKKTIRSTSDIGKIVRAKYQIEVSPISEQNITLKAGSYKFTSGEEITLNDGFILENGVDFEATIDENLKYEPEQGCQKVCLYLPNVFTPNGDGINDVWGFNQAFMVSYRINIWDANNKSWFHCGNRPLYENCFVPVWDGKGAPNGIYYGSINYTDCYGVERNKTFFVHIYGSSNKSSVVSHNSVKIPDTEVLNESFRLLPDLNIYPNPTNGKVMIDCFSPEGNYEYIILNQSGKTIIQDCGNDRLELDLSDYAPGMYILKVKVGDEYMVRKIIKR